jgi:putative peptide zinc metalloprotease protein
MRGPMLQPGVVLVEQHYRGEQSFVLKDPRTQKYYRFRPAEAAVIQSFDGSRTIEEIVEALSAQGRAITVGAVEGFARTLSRMGLLQRTLVERTRHQLERLRTERRQQRSLFRGEWLRMRWSFGDADAFFTRGMPAVRWCFTRTFVMASVLLFAAYAWILVAQWQAFGAAVASTFAPPVVTMGGVGIILVTALVLTLIHELGHGFACKHYGGEVHELGFMILYFSPSFYCNVNDAWSFPALRARLWVTAAGSWIELVVSAIAAIVWVIAQPDTLVSQYALAAMLIGGFMTIVTNGNPLMPLDGYFALSDYLEMPNLRHRASAHLTWWFRRHLLRLDLPEPDVPPSERRLLLTYGALALAYGIAFISWVALLVIGWATALIGFLGGALIVLALVGVLWSRIVNFWRGTLVAVRAQVGGASWRRWRRWTPIGAGLGFVIAALLPWNLQSRGTFVVAPVQSLAVVAPDSGIVVAVHPETGNFVAAGTPVVRMLDLDLMRTLARDTRTTDSLLVLGQVAQAQASAASEALLHAERRAASADVVRSQVRLEQGVLRTRLGGTVVTARPERLIGQWVGPGDTLLVIADLTALEARIALRSPGSTRITPGRRVRLVSHQAAEAPLEGVVREVATAGTSAERGAIEVRMTLPEGSRLRAGATGHASVEWGQSTLLGALWWSLRAQIRSDLLL